MHASHLLLSINSLSGLARPRAGLLRLYASIPAIVLAIWSIYAGEEVATEY